MGQFSWITQDTGEPIRTDSNDQRDGKAYLHDNKGNVWEELNYEGYGEFGGKDFYVLVAEMNRPEEITDDEEKNRDLGLYIAFSEKPYKSPNLTRNKDWTWINEAPKLDPNQGWEN